MALSVIKRMDSRSSWKWPDDLDTAPRDKEGFSSKRIDTPLNGHVLIDPEHLPFDLSDPSLDFDIPDFVHNQEAYNRVDDPLSHRSPDLSNGQHSIHDDALKSPYHSSQGDHDHGEAPDDGEIDYEGADDISEPRRELRPQTRNPTGFFTTWVDQDDTGDFDPSEENRQAYRDRMKLRQRLPICQSKLNSSKRNATITEQTPQLMVNIRFASDFGAIQFAQLIRNLPDRLPRPSAPADTTGRGLRKRNQYVEYNEDNSSNKRQRLDGTEVPDDTTGHPFARGCWHCTMHGEDCSLLENENSWPCTTCIDETCDCVLVIPPKRKQPCQRCRSRKIKCSYGYTLNHGVACQQCVENHQDCVAGPARDFIGTRIRYDRDWATDPLNSGKKPPKIYNYLPCADCRDAGRSCAFETDGNHGMAGRPCAQCVETGDLCGLYSLNLNYHGKAQLELPSRKPMEGSTMETDKAPPESPASEPHPPLARNASCTGEVKHITTKLSHPITFNHINDDNTNNSPCHFCSDIAYGIIGLEKRQVEVIEWSDGRGYEEISGGHRGDGVDNTRMCPQCTLARLTIVVCAGHTMSAIPQLGWNSEADDEVALMELLSGTQKGGREWCSICPTPASWRCVTANDEEPCGLMLCRDCDRMMRRYGGDLQEMLRNIKDESSESKPLGLRADWELLKDDGLLMKFMYQGEE